MAAFVCHWDWVLGMERQWVHKGVKININEMMQDCTKGAFYVLDSLLPGKKKSLQLFETTPKQCS